MNARIRTPIASLVAALVAGMGFASSALAQKAEVIHWWTSGGESAAVKQLAEAYNKAGGQWVDNAIAGGDNARAAALNRIAGGNPPAASQFNTSKQYHELIEAGLLNNVDDVAAKEGWEQWMPTPIKNVIKVKGHYYAVPVNIHSATWFWYSKAVLAKAGVAEPKNEAEFWAALDKIKASGQIAFAQSGTLTYERAAFTAVLLHMGGRDLYTKFYGDKDANAVKSAEFRTVLEKFKKLRSYADAGFAGPQLERRHRDAGYRQGRLPDHGRLGQGRIHRRGQDRGQGLRLLPGLAARRRRT